MTAAIDKVEKVDDYTVKLSLKEPFGAMIGSLASPYFSIMIACLTFTSSSGFASIFMFRDSTAAMSVL